MRNLSTFDYLHFDQIDYFLVRNRWKNTVKNAETDPDAPIDSDHYPLWMRNEIKFKRIRKQPHYQNKFDFDVDDETKQQFNNEFRSQLGHGVSGDGENIETALNHAAKHLNAKPTQARKPWISENTLRLIEEKHWLEQNRNETTKDKIKEIRKSKRNDWKVYTERIISDELDIKDKWMGIAFLNKNAQTEFIRIRRPTWKQGGHQAKSRSYSRLFGQ